MLHGHPGRARAHAARHGAAGTGRQVARRRPGPRRPPGPCHGRGPGQASDRSPCLEAAAVGRRGPVGPTGPAGKPGTGTSTVTYTIVPPSVRPTAPPEGGATLGTGARAIKFNLLTFGVAGAGTGVAKASHEIVITKHTDQASAKLFRACTTGKHFPTVTITVRKKSGGTQTYLVITMTNVVISADQTSSTQSGERPTETLTLNFTKIEFKHVSQ